MGRLQGKTAIITGAASGMGAVHARTFIDEGANVVLTDVADTAGQELASTLGAGALFVHHDVTEPGSWTNVVEQTVRTFGTIDVLVNNAGLAGPVATVATMTDADYLRTINIDQHGVFYGMRAVIPTMIAAGGGSIVNISSIAGFVHQIDVPNPAYTAAKFAVRGLTKAAAVQFGPDKIRVNSVHPGGILTPMLVANMPADAGAGLPLRRFGEPSEVSQLVVFLASDDSSYITGAEHLIDGGQTAD